MFGTTVFVKDTCNVVHANIIKTEGITAIAEINGKYYTATYDRDSKLFHVDCTKEKLQTA